MGEMQPDDEVQVMDDNTDPLTAILYKPYMISSDQARWICQALLGHMVERLFTCHVCYNVFETPTELEVHFLANHPSGLLNRYYGGRCWRIV